MVKACLFENGNKQVVELESAKISALDSAYLFGDGIYEVIAVVSGRFYDLEPHLERLEKSLKIVSIPLPLPVEKLKHELAEIIKLNNAADKTGYVYLQVTRGSHFQRDFMPHKETAPTLFAYFAEQKNFPQQNEDEGETSLLFPDIRWGLKHVKTTQLLSSRLAKKTAYENGAQEPIYINKDGIITEGGSTNVFIVKDGEILTHPEDSGILWGITRRRVIQLAESQGYKVTECKFNLDALLSADEVFRTASTQGVRAVSHIKIINNPPLIFGHVEKEAIWQPQGYELGNHKIGNGKAGKIARQLSALYVELANGRLKDKDYENGKVA